VGIDQAPHVELTREIARRFNYFYGDVFPIPDTILTETSKILGTDRRKMSKSYGNAIFLSDPPEVVLNKVSQMVTDPQRARRSDPGNPDVCNVFTFHGLYSGHEIVERVDSQCRKAEIGCVECKKLMAENLIAAMEPVRKKRAEYESRPDTVTDIMEQGNQKAQAVARRTMEEVRAAVKI
jgi:tryptophanyl-tRNA synthetase